MPCRTKRPLADKRFLKTRLIPNQNGSAERLHDEFHRRALRGRLAMEESAIRQKASGTRTKVDRTKQCPQMSAAASRQNRRIAVEVPEEVTAFRQRKPHRCWPVPVTGYDTR